MCKIYALLLLLLYGSFLKGQFYDNGQDAFSTKWKYIETENFKVIFSDKVKEKGKIYASYLEKCAKTGGLTLTHKPRKVPVIIHNENVLANGEVAWAPRRMNLYAMAPQFGNSELYAKHLALHEYRHVVQIDKINNNITRAFYYALGEQFIGGILGWHVPLWFLEGDAVVYETGASNTGRGRDPDFLMKIKAQLDEFGLYSYPKAQFGSYKSFVPNSYELGYYLTTKARIKYGAHMWSGVLNQVSKSPIHPNAFSKGIKTITGFKERDLYKNLMMADLLTDTACNSIESKKKITYSNYYSPYIYNSGFISYKTNFSDLPSLVLHNAAGSLKDKTILVTDNIIDKTFSFADSIIVWNEFQKKRWENSNYTCIVKYNIHSKKKSYLKKNLRVFHSRISPCKRKIVSVENDGCLNWLITIRDAQTGNLTDSVPFGNMQPVQPAWANGTDSIVFIQVGEKGKSLVLLDLKSKVRTDIVNATYAELSNPIFYKNYIYIKGVYNQSSNVLRYSLKNSVWEALTNERYGIGEYGILNDSVIYSSYTAYGYKVKYLSIDDKSFETVHLPEIVHDSLSEHLKESEMYIDFSQVDTSDFEILNYSRFANLFRFHSWAPFGFDLQSYDAGLGVTALSQNELSTSFFSGGFLYNPVDFSRKYFVNYDYKGLYPYLNSNYSKTYRTAHSENALQLGFIIPVVFDRGTWKRRIHFQLAYEFIHIKPHAGYELRLTNPNISNVYYKFSYSHLRKQSLRDILPKWGYDISLSYMNSIAYYDHLGELAIGEANVYVPGVIKNHGIRIYGAYQKKNAGELAFSDRINYPYGYTVFNNDEMVTLQGFYNFPIIYPDLNIYEWVYVKRLKANVFYQHASYKHLGKAANITASGFDLTTKLHLFRFVFPVETGVRFSRLIESKRNYYQFLVSFIL